MHRSNVQTPIVGNPGSARTFPMIDIRLDATPKNFFKTYIVQLLNTQLEPL